MHVILPDGKRLELADHAVGGQLAAAIGPGLAKAALGVVVDGGLADLMTELPDGAEVAVLTKRDERVVELVRHTLAHVMAQAVREQMEAEGFGADQVKLGIGPVIAGGFYYDFDLPRSLTPEDLPVIDERMRAIVRDDLPLAKFALPRDAALERYHEAADPYKTGLIEDLPLEVPITFYQQGGPSGFTDLCRGPHLPSTGALKPHFRLMSLAGAYWRGDENRPMLQRIYGVAFSTAEQLERHLWQIEEAKKRDHRKLGAELDIFVLDEDVGPGLPLWLPRGAIMIEEIEALAKEVEERAGYDRVRSPHLSKEQLFVKSGHLEHYQEDMFPPMELENVRYYMKPMNCPFHHKIFDARPRSYRDLPLRLAEYGTCYRYEGSGALMGLLRVRSMQMNDAHIYCTEEQFEEEFLAVIGLYLEYFRIFEIDEYLMRLSKHSPEGLGKKYVGNREMWLKTEAMVRNAMVHGGINFVEADDEAAFYGPKIDVQVTSAIGREFSLATNQVDFAQPQRLGLEYVDADNERRIPLCIHRAPLGTHERFIGFLIEHYGGDFPVWLAPRAGAHRADRRPTPRLRRVAAERRSPPPVWRAEVDASGERMNAKILKKIVKPNSTRFPTSPSSATARAENGQLSFRSRKEPDRSGVEVAPFVGHLQAAVRERASKIEPLPA